MSTILECLSKIERSGKLLSMDEINLFFVIFSTVAIFFFFFVLRNRGCSMKLFLTATFNARVRVAISVCLFNRMNK